MLAPKKAGEDQAIGRSKGGLSTKIHTLVDALGNPLDFFLSPGCQFASNRDPLLECAPEAGQDQAAVLTVGQAC